MQNIFGGMFSYQNGCGIGIHFVSSAFDYGNLGWSANANMRFEYKFSERYSCISECNAYALKFTSKPRGLFDIGDSLELPKAQNSPGELSIWAIIYEKSDEVVPTKYSYLSVFDTEQSSYYHIDILYKTMLGKTVNTNFKNYFENYWDSKLLISASLCRASTVYSSRDFPKKIREKFEDNKAAEKNYLLSVGLFESFSKHDIMVGLVLRNKISSMNICLISEASLDCSVYPISSIIYGVLNKYAVIVPKETMDNEIIISQYDHPLYREVNVLPTFSSKVSGFFLFNFTTEIIFNSSNNYSIFMFSKLSTRFNKTAYGGSEKYDQVSLDSKKDLDVSSNIKSFSINIAPSYTLFIIGVGFELSY
ncbi:MAG: hypothetical protein KAH32_04075 [Chlamydiia bacterium]|nr:hypothetical protein [Chlamydiia bacterium]